MERVSQAYNKSIQKIEILLDTSRVRGLSRLEATKRQTQFGKNLLPEAKPRSLGIIFISQFKGPFGIVLIVATAIAAWLSDTTDAAIIGAAILINVITGFLQEAKAERTLYQLKTLLRLEARVLRDHEEQKILSEELVPGDIIYIEEGDQVPADARLLASFALEANEAALTGESQPSAKDHEIIKQEVPLAEMRNMVFAGTIITRGHGSALVIETAKTTEIGKIASALTSIRNEASPLEKRFAKFSWYIGIAALALVVIIFFVGLASGIEFLEMFKTAIAVSVAVIPEGLLVVVTVTLALGVKKMARHKAIIRNLAAAETLGSTTVICTDKTGTLTEGIMEVTRLSHVTANHKISEEIDHPSFEDSLKIMLLCNNATIGYEGDKEIFIGEPTEAALIQYAFEQGRKKHDAEKREPRVDEVPFDYKKKFMITVHESHDKTSQHIYAKGAPEVILARCTHILVDGVITKLTHELREVVEKQNSELAKEGFRNLALAQRTVVGKSHGTSLDSNLVFVSIVSLHDPIRLYVEESLKTTEQAGIRTVLITGDNVHTAQSIMKSLGFPLKEDEILEGHHIAELSQEQLQQKVSKIKLFARVTPEDKLHIIRALRANGEIVAMTGDGVNDTPALKASDIGIGMGSGTELAKETADMVILDDNFGTIVHAVEEGRVIFDNIKKIIAFILGTNLGETLLVLAALIFGLPIPLVAAQIIWVNLVSDGAPAIALASEPKEEDVMLRAPRDPKEALVTKLDLKRILYVGFVTGAIALGVFALSTSLGDSLEHARTMTFTIISLTTLVAALSYRGLRSSIFKRKLFSNPALVWSLALSVLLQLAGIYVPFLQNLLETVPLGIGDWGIIIACEILALIFIEARNFFFKEPAAQTKVAAQS